MTTSTANSTDAPPAAQPEVEQDRGSVDLDREAGIASYFAAIPATERGDAFDRVNRRVKLQADPDDLEAPPRFDFAADLGDIARGGIPEPDRLVPDLLYVNYVHWLSGHPGHGKSTIAAAAARQHMNAGGHVVWLDWEAGLRPTIARMLAVGAEPEQLDALFHLAISPPLSADADGFAKIAAALDAYPGALIVFDSASKALSLAGFDENNTAEATKWTTNIAIPAREAGATVIVIDHVTKGATRSNPYPRGAGSKLADTDVAWYVEATVRFNRETPGKVELTSHKDREGLLPERLAFEVGDGEGGLPVKQVAAEDEDTRGKREAGMRGKVLATLQEHSTPEQRLSGNQIEKLTTGKADDIRAARDELVAMGGSGVEAAPDGRGVGYWYDPETRQGADEGGQRLGL